MCWQLVGNQNYFWENGVPYTHLVCTHLLISDAAFTGESYTILSPAKPTSRQFKISPIDAHSAPRPFKKIKIKSIMQYNIHCQAQ